MRGGSRRQSNCAGTGLKVAGRARGDGAMRVIRCPECKRLVAVNYDGRVRHHVAALLKEKA